MASARLRGRSIWSVLVFLVLIVLIFAGLRVAVDGPNLASGEIPDDAFERRYALHPVIAYAHILPGVIYLIAAPFQLNHGFRERHFTLHRRMGRVLVPAGIAAGVFGIIFGSRFPFGGVLESSATVVFGGYFIVALSVALIAIRAGDATRHRRWTELRGRRGSRRSGQDEAMTTAAGTVRSAAGTTIAYERCGTGPAVVLIVLPGLSRPTAVPAPRRGSAPPRRPVWPAASSGTVSEALRRP